MTHVILIFMFVYGSINPTHLVTSEVILDTILTFEQKQGNSPCLHRHDNVIYCIFSFQSWTKSTLYFPKCQVPLKRGSGPLVSVISLLNVLWIRWVVFRLMEIEQLTRLLAVIVINGSCRCGSKSSLLFKNPFSADQSQSMLAWRSTDSEGKKQESVRHICNIL